MYDVLVVGAGSVGSHLAARMAGLGYKVMVFEEHPNAGEAVCCTGIVGKECLDRFPVDSEVVLRTVNSATVFSPSGIALHADSEATMAYILDRSAFDACLAAKAQEAGADHLWGSRINNILLGQDSDTVEVDNSARCYKGKTVVIASGFHSRLTERVGLGRVRDFAAGAQVEVASRDVGELEVYFGRNVTPGLFGWVVPTCDGRVRVGLLARRNPGEYLRRFLSTLERQGKIEVDDARVSFGSVPLRPLARTYAERTIVVGDAAGHVKPTTAGGIYYGLLCAEDAVDTLHEALSKEDYRTAMFAGYEKRWKRRLGGELRAGRWARWFFERCSDERIDRGFRVLESRDIPKAVLRSSDFSFDWHRSLILKSVRLAGVRGMIQMLRPG